MIPNIKSAAKKMLIDFEDTQSIEHNVIKGQSREAIIVKEFLSPYLPKRYSIDTGILVDINDIQSKQLDLIIFDSFFAPILKDLESNKLLFPETVFAMIESKSTLNKKEINDIIKKSSSVWNISKTYQNKIVIAPGMLVPSLFYPPLCIGFVFKSNISLADIQKDLNNIIDIKDKTVSIIAVLKDKNNETGLILCVDKENLANILTAPTKTSKYGLVKCESEGDTLLYLYLLLMAHLNNCGTIIPQPNYQKYAEASGLAKPQILFDKDTIRDASFVTEGKKLKISTVQNMSQWTKKLFEGTATDEEILSLFFHMVDLPSGDIIANPKTVFIVDKKVVSFSKPSEVFGIISKMNKGDINPKEKNIIHKYLQMVRDVVSNKQILEMTYPKTT
ncbi:MAG: hypothetical protein KAX16_00365 [Actinomycetia bacterium]|nr:hypothetical protein [Actinomycetes bacterium]